MRPGQQNRRSRGRNNNNNNNNGNRNRSQNPLSRTYESSGPDVKIRGNPQHIAEKYTTLARDALSAGDRVMAENYLQHAEHYNRIIATAMAQLNQSMEQSRRDWDDDNDGDQDDGDGDASGRNDVPQARQDSRQDSSHADAADSPQPELNGTPAEFAEKEAASTNGQQDSGSKRSRPRRPRRNAGREQDGADEGVASTDSGNGDAVAAAPVAEPAMVEETAAD